MALKQFETKKIYLGNNELKAVYLGDTKVRAKTMPAGIYHNATLGLISLSSDGSTWITIADKNLGATNVYNNGDTLSQANCGTYFQWGNNYGFPITGSVTTYSNRVNASSYGPNNYYSGSYFRTKSGWDSSNNANLWGGTTGTNEAMQGPCDTGFHIATKTERGDVVNIGVSLGAWTVANGSNIKSYLKMPYAGYRDYNSSATVREQGTRAVYRSSILMEAAIGYAMSSTEYGIDAGGQFDISTGCSIRPFKNEAVQPDSSRTKLY